MDGEARKAAADLAKAFQDLSRGEQTAASMESNLDGLESKIDQLLQALGQDGLEEEVGGEVYDESKEQQKDKIGHDAETNTAGK